MTRRPALVAVAALAAAVLLLGPSASTAVAQEGSSSSTSSTIAELPPAEIIPRPNSGHAPTEAGDRGGALQLAVLGLVVVALGAGVAKLVHDSRRARASEGD